MTTQDTEGLWWQRTPVGMTFEDWLLIWNTILPREVRVLLLGAISQAYTLDMDAAKIRFLLTLFGDIQSEDSTTQRTTIEIAELAAEQLVNIALSRRTLWHYAKEPQLFPDILRVLLHQGHFFDDKKKQLRHKVKDSLQWLYGPARRPWTDVFLQESEDGKAVVNAHLPMLVECLCAYDLFDVIEDTADSTLLALERFATRHDSQVERVAYQGQRDQRESAAARQLLYLRAKRVHLAEKSA